MHPFPRLADDALRGSAAFDVLRQMLPERLVFGTGFAQQPGFARGLGVEVAQHGADRVAGEVLGDGLLDASQVTQDGWLELVFHVVLFPLLMGRLMPSTVGLPDAWQQRSSEDD